jgi:hypothetical protein
MLALFVWRQACEYVFGNLWILIDFPSSVMMKCAAEDMCIQIRGSMDLCCLLALSLAYNKLGVNSNGRMLQFFLFTITVAFQGFSIPCVRPENFARPPEFLIKKNCCNFYISARPHWLRSGGAAEPICENLNSKHTIGLRWVAETSSTAAASHLCISLCVACPVCTSEMHIPYSYRRCISDLHARTAWRTLTSDTHTRVRMMATHIEHAYRICICEMQIEYACRRSQAASKHSL